ncbi:MAG: NAD(P)H-dependent oxidoreductase subunit E [Nitrospirota bacterium]
MDDKLLNKILNDFSAANGNLITLLQRIQDAFGYVPEHAVAWFSRKLDIPESSFFGVITFYPKFRLKPVGKNTVTVCCGAACHIKGGDKILKKVRETLSLPEGEDTTANLSFTVEKATCIGACSIAPVVILNNEVYGTTDPEGVAKLLKGYEKEDEFLGYLL